ncbi:hypothetical protein [Streptomyces sp. NPDC057403]|uniref:hypothetical protein n=1 Tax=Streptomyces sp. NPDC057403 TaxID=3346119 RepID=UPI0036AD343D
MTSAVVSSTGVYCSSGTEHDLSLAAAWRCLDASSDEERHSVVLAVADAEGAVAWSAPDGLRIVRLTRGSSVQPGLPYLGPVHHHRVATPASRRAPVTMLMTDTGLDLLWSPDHHSVQWLNERPGIPIGPAAPRPELELRGERLGTLDVTLDTSRTAWLAAATERGALLLARWDLVYDVVEPWERLQCPLPAVRRAVLVRVAGRPTILAVAPDGTVLATDLRAAVARGAPWNAVEVPSGLRVLRATAGIVAVSDSDGRARLAAASGNRLWSADLTCTAGRTSCSAVIEAVIN